MIAETLRAFNQQRSSASIWQTKTILTRLQISSSYVRSFSIHYWNCIGTHGFNSKVVLVAASVLVKARHNSKPAIFSL